MVGLSCDPYAIVAEHVITAIARPDNDFLNNI
nr:MAG TPA_asm: hypothetical protein [Caudoviricetes sp.]